MEGSGKGASLSAGALLGEPAAGTPFLGILKDMGWRAQGMDITLRGGSAGEFSRGLVYRGRQKSLETGTSFTGALFSIMRGPFTGNSER